jgi:hypothetical protein
MANWPITGFWDDTELWDDNDIWFDGNAIVAESGDLELSGAIIALHWDRLRQVRFRYRKN